MNIVVKILSAVLLVQLCAACVGKTLSDTKEIEEYSLRQATPSEMEKLKSCARAIRDEENKYRKTHKHYQLKLKDLRVDEPCSDIFVQLHGDELHFIAGLRLNGNNSTVKWELNEKGEVIELTDEDISDDLSF